MTLYMCVCVCRKSESVCVCVWEREIEQQGNPKRRIYCQRKSMLQSFGSNESLSGLEKMILCHVKSPMDSFNEIQNKG